MYLQILYDNNARDNFKAGWGFSCLIKTSSENILFDTGWNGNILLHNLKIADVSPGDINRIVISHSHWDHIGGLNHILIYGRKPRVYVPKSISNNLKNEIKKDAKIIDVSKPQNICENIWTTGELGEKIKEQSLVIKTEKGVNILTGCAHPGLENIIKRSREWGEIYGIVGGFHDSNIDILKGIPLIMSCHCTEKIGEIRQKLPESYKECFAGVYIEL